MLHGAVTEQGARQGLHVMLKHLAVSTQDWENPAYIT